MSYTPLPKNSKLDSAVVRSRKPDYFIAHGDAKPVPTAEELAGKEELILADSQGNRYVWNGDAGGIWTPTHLRGAFNIHDADPHWEPINHFMWQPISSTTITADITSQDTHINLTSVAGLVAGISKLHLSDMATSAHDHSMLLVTNIVGNLVTVNRPIDHDFSVAGTIVDVVNTNMAVAGTLAAPVSFILIPSPGEIWHISSLNFSIIDNAAMDDSLFGSLPALTNGVVIRSVDSVNSVYESFSTWQANEDFGLDNFEVEYATKAPAGSYSFRGNMNVHEGYGSIVRLANTSDETVYMEVLIQDDLSTQTSFTIKMHGHIENE